MKKNTHWNTQNKTQQLMFFCVFFDVFTSSSPLNFKKPTKQKNASNPPLKGSQASAFRPKVTGAQNVVAAASGPR